MRRGSCFISVEREEGHFSSFSCNVMIRSLIKGDLLKVHHHKSLFSLPEPFSNNTAITITINTGRTNIQEPVTVLVIRDADVSFKLHPTVHTRHDEARALNSHK